MTEHIYCDLVMYTATALLSPVQDPSGAPGCCGSVALAVVDYGSNVIDTRGERGSGPTGRPLTTFPRYPAFVLSFGHLRDGCVTIMTRSGWGVKGFMACL